MDNFTFQKLMNIKKEDNQKVHKQESVEMLTEEKETNQNVNEVEDREGYVARKNQN